jgi:hypothetical protein
MNYDIGACKECANIAGTTKDHKCAACGAERVTVPLYTWFHQDYDLIENPETIEKMDEMDNTEVKASAVGAAELKAGLRDLFICIGIAVALALFGLLCVRMAGGSVKGRMSFMGLLFFFASPVMLIVGFFLFFKHAFSKARAKTPEKAFELFWNAVFETKTFSGKYENVEIAVDKITRSLPGAVRQTIDTAKTQSWVSGLRDMIASSNSELAQDCFNAYKDQVLGAKGDDDSLTIQNISTETIDEHKAIISADLVVSRKWTRSIQNRNNTDYFNYQMSAGILHAKTTLLKAGEYWYVPDWMPKIEKGELTNAWKEANP